MNLVVKKEGQEKLVELSHVDLCLTHDSFGVRGVNLMSNVIKVFIFQPQSFASYWSDVLSRLQS